MTHTVKHVSTVCHFISQKATSFLCDVKSVMSFSELQVRQQELTESYLHEKKNL